VNTVNHITGIVLAGGKSKRMGREKGRVLLNGKELIQYSIDAIKPLCSYILISSGLTSFNDLGYEVVPDIYPGKGPMGGIYSALKRSKTNLNLVLSCDIPFVSTQLLQHLLEMPKKYSVCIPEYKNLPEPLSGRYNLSVLPQMKACLLKNQLKLVDFLSKEKVRWVPVGPDLPFYNPNLFMNINRPRDLEKAEHLINPKK